MWSNKLNVRFLWWMQKKIFCKTLEMILWSFQNSACCSFNWRQNLMHAWWSLTWFNQYWLIDEYWKTMWSSWKWSTLWHFMEWSYLELLRMGRKWERSFIYFWGWYFKSIFKSPKFGHGMSSSLSSRGRIWIFWTKRIGHNFLSTELLRRIW